VKSMEVTIEPCDPLACLDAVYEVFCLAQGVEGPRQRAWRDEHLPHHAARSDFDFLAARASDGELAGIVYGYTGAYGQWWTDRIAAAMGARARAAWLDRPHFEVVELQVRPSAQRRGVGRRLLTSLLARQPHERALLTTHEHGPGMPFYTLLGWRRLADLRFEPGGPLMVVMGLDGLRDRAA
jgi:GNAT superfamily N-acetyltransferase